MFTVRDFLIELHDCIKIPFSKTYLLLKYFRYLLVSSYNIKENTMSIILCTGP